MKTMKHWLLDRTGLGGILVRVAMLNGVVVNVVLAALAVAALQLGWLARGNVSTDLSAIFLWLFGFRQGDDSWRPMLRALDCFQQKLPIYQTIFFEQHDKFQYPLTSLLPLYWLRQFGMSDDGILSLLNVATWIALWVAIAISVRILMVTAARRGYFDDLRGRQRVLVGAAIAVCGLTFYPLVKNYVLGQAQTFLSLMFAAALLLWIQRRYARSGALFGLMCLIKPQYGLILLWFALRKRFSAFVAGTAVLVTGTAAGTAIFGWREQFEYLNVLRYIAQRGESYWPNESFNGLLNHLFFNGANLQWPAHSFAPYSPFIYAATAISSACLIGCALLFPFARRARGGVLDFCVMAITATVASPVAWEHHYGILLPIFAYLAGVLTATRHRMALLVAYVLTSHSWSPMNVFAHVPVLNALQSLRFFGVLFLLYFLYRNGRRAELAAAEDERDAQMVSATISMAPQGHSSTHSPQPLQYS